MAVGNDRIFLFLSQVALLVLINNGSSNGLLPDGTKPLPEPKKTNHDWSLIWGIQFMITYLQVF